MPLRRTSRTETTPDPLRVPVPTRTLVAATGTWAEKWERPGWGIRVSQPREVLRWGDRLMNFSVEWNMGGVRTATCL